MSHRFTAPLLALLILAPLTALAATATVTIVQKKRAFSLGEVTLTRNAVVDFTNEDNFPHQLHISGPGMDVDSDLQSPGQTIAVPFPAPGVFTARRLHRPLRDPSPHAQHRPRQIVARS